jgi:DNA-directed RNA polymerase specialized sigma24 family protein
MVAVSNDVLDRTVLSTEWNPEKIAETRDVLRTMLSRLPRDERRAFELFCLDGLSLLDASLEMKTSPRRVRQLVGDAESRLRRIGRQLPQNLAAMGLCRRPNRMNWRYRKRNAIRIVPDFAVPAR